MSPSSVSEEDSEPGETSFIGSSVEPVSFLTGLLSLEGFRWGSCFGAAAVLVLDLAKDANISECSRFAGGGLPRKNDAVALVVGLLRSNFDSGLVEVEEASFLRVGGGRDVVLGLGIGTRGAVGI